MTVNKVNERLVGDIKLLMRDAEDLLKVTAGNAGEMTAQGANRLANVLNSAKDTYGRAREKTAIAAKAADKSIREHPYRAIGVSLGIGLLLGALMARR